MSPFVPIVVVLVGLGGLEPPGGSGQALQPATRLIEGASPTCKGIPCAKARSCSRSRILH